MELNSSWPLTCRWHGQHSASLANILYETQHEASRGGVGRPLIPAFSGILPLVYSLGNLPPAAARLGLEPFQACPEPAAPLSQMLATTSQAPGAFPETLYLRLLPGRQHHPNPTKGLRPAPQSVGPGPGSRVGGGRGSLPHTGSGFPASSWFAPFALKCRFFLIESDPRFIGGPV